MGDEKMIPESQLITFKKAAENRETKLREQVAKANGELTERNSAVRTLEAQLKTSKLNLEDDEKMKEVRSYLLDEDKRIQDLQAEIDKKVASVKERERGARAKELALDGKSKGLEITPEELLEAEDMEKFSSTKYVEFLAKENERLKNEPSTPETVFERGAGGVVTKTVANMSDAEFDKHWDSSMQGALQK